MRRRTLAAVAEAMNLVSEVLGVFTTAPDVFLARLRDKLCAARGIDPEQVERSINERNQARKAKDFARADDLRKELTDSGVELMDGPGGTSWRVDEG